ncbi:MAG: hypothetical protein U0930_15140 [Pirellulales bacterium]
MRSFGFWFWFVLNVLSDGSRFALERNLLEPIALLLGGTILLAFSPVGWVLLAVGVVAVAIGVVKETQRIFGSEASS